MLAYRVSFFFEVAVSGCLGTPRMRLKSSRSRRWPPERECQPDGADLGADEALARVEERERPPEL